MFDILLAGVGGQGTVLAAKMLAHAAQNRGYNVRSAETIGMAQRGGSVTSHLRLSDEGVPSESSMIMPKSADVIIAFEPGEAANRLSFLKDDGIIITARTEIAPITASLSGEPYSSEEILESLESALTDDQRLCVVDDQQILDTVGNSKCLNTVLVAFAVGEGAVPVGFEDLEDAVRACVKPRFVDLNLSAIDIVKTSLNPL
ncbi:MAG: indolepyruvate oxidoreductase subunit beta [Eggerthellaceae bacterium]|nr:indolepyruvate oxidoreductase subunit beta [Eggerthellaceae bacterium]